VIEEEISHWVRRYRSTIAEEPTPVLDELILRTARRRAVRVRTTRRSMVMLALATIFIWPLWNLHVSRAPEATDVSSYGRLEGATRYYLLNVVPSPYSGPGTMEQNR